MVQNLQDPRWKGWSRSVSALLSFAILIALFLYQRQPENSFAFSGEAKNKAYANEIIHECNEAWKNLMTGSVKSEISLWVQFLISRYKYEANSKWIIHSANVNVAGSAGHISTSDAAYAALPADSRAAPAPIDPSISKSFFISGGAMVSR
jgi:inorganic pyrophosphatase